MNVNEQLNSLRDETKGGRTVALNAVDIAAWKNTNRRVGVNPRTGKEFNDSHLNGRITLDPMARLRMPGDTAESGNTGPTQLEAMQIAAKEGGKVPLFFDLWFADGTPSASGGEKPVLSGHANALVVPRQATDEEAEQNVG